MFIYESMDQIKIPRKRDVNFTAKEKALLAQLIRRKPIIGSKLTDGKTVAKKQLAWDTITREFNCNSNVHKRETQTLKRAWDNMKCHARKAHVAGKGNPVKTTGLDAPSQLEQDSLNINSIGVEDAPLTLCELKNAFDSDGAILNAMDNSGIDTSTTPMDILKCFLDEKKLDSEEDLDLDVHENHESSLPDTDMSHNNCSNKNSSSNIKNSTKVRRSIDYIRREAAMRIKYLEHNNSMEMQILNTQLEIEQIKKRSALLEEERNRVLLQKAKIELETVIAKQIST